MSYFNTNLSQVVNFSHVVGNELSEIGIETSEIQVAEVSGCVILCSQEKVIIIFSVGKSDCVFSQGSSFPAENIIHVK